MQITISVAACEKSMGESKTFLGVVDVQNCSFYRQIISEAESTAARRSPMGPTSALGCWRVWMRTKSNPQGLKPRSRNGGGLPGLKPRPVAAGLSQDLGDPTA